MPLRIGVLLLMLSSILSCAHAAYVGDGELEPFAEYSFEANQIKKGSAGRMESIPVEYVLGKEPDGRHLGVVLEFQWKHPNKSNCCSQTVFNEKADGADLPIVRGNQLQWKIIYDSGSSKRCWKFSKDRSRLEALKRCSK